MNWNCYFFTYLFFGFPDATPCISNDNNFELVQYKLRIELCAVQYVFVCLSVCQSNWVALGSLSYS